ncbi:MAG: hypothetical protein KQA41_01005 [Candidatus Aenigmarchaeota archaeon]|nr:hypothetical protein [Candidatus Aenigmarchaeota archaeon]MBU5688793.1 hypothetical protein [Candidatus Aenigmarchaeota archaeon]
MNIAIIGSKGLAKELGKSGTKSDLALYNTSFQGKYFTFIEPQTYPEKIQTLFQTLNMSQFAILYITKDIEKIALGESIIALDILEKQGIIFLDGVDEAEILNLIKETNLKNYRIIKDVREVMQFLANLNIETIKEKPKVLIDHSFIVKSVGLVALGTVISGEIKKYDKLYVYPSKKEVLIKSIQIHDKDFDKAECFDRVGLALKGVELEDVERGNIIGENLISTKKLDGVSITKNKFYKDEIPSNVMCIVGLQYVNAKINENSIDFSKEIVFDNEKVIILTPDKKMRILGYAVKN